MNKTMNLTAWNKKDMILENVSALIPAFVQDIEKFTKNVQNDILRMENDYLVARIDSLNESILKYEKKAKEDAEKYTEYTAKARKAEKDLKDTQDEYRLYKLALIDLYNVLEEKDLPAFVYGDKVSCAYVLSLGLARSANITFDSFDLVARGILAHARTYSDVTEWDDGRKADCIRLRDKMTTYLFNMVDVAGYDKNRLQVSAKDFTATFSACIPFVKSAKTKNGLFGTQETQRKTSFVFFAMFRSILHRNGVALPKEVHTKNQKIVSANF